MPDIHIVRFEEHGNKRWFKPKDYRFAANDRVVAVGLSELPKAMLSLPLAFVKTEQSYQPVVVQGLLPGQNLLVTPQGQWVADYIPLLYRALPFRLAKNSAGESVLVVDHDTGLITDTAAGFQFYKDEKTLAAETQETATLLMQFENERPHIPAICKLLGDHEVIEPWPLHVQLNDGVRTVEGLYRINEGRLRELAPEVLAQIRDCSGLMICYAQLFSMQHIQQLGAVAQRTHWAARAMAQATKVVPLNIVDDNGILSFANL